MKELPIVYQIIAEKIRNRFGTNEEFPLSEVRIILGLSCKIPKCEQTKVIRELVDMKILKIIKVQNVVLLI